METVSSRESWILRVLRWLRPRPASAARSDRPESTSPFPWSPRRIEDVEALVSVSREPSGDSVLRDPALCPSLRRLLDASGCGILLFDPIRESFHPVAAAGAWDGLDLAELLQAEGAAWGFAFSQGVAFARRSGGHPEPVCAMESGEIEASCVAVPLLADGERIGGLVVSYSDASGLPAKSLSVIQFLAEFVALHAVADRAKAERHRQAEQICRLTSDVERMAILLRGLTASKKG